MYNNIDFGIFLEYLKIALKGSSYKKDHTNYEYNLNGEQYYNYILICKSIFNDSDIAESNNIPSILYYLYKNNIDITTDNLNELLANQNFNKTHLKIFIKSLIKTDSLSFIKVLFYNIDNELRIVGLNDWTPSKTQINDYFELLDDFNSILTEYPMFKPILAKLIRINGYDLYIPMMNYNTSGKEWDSEYGTKAVNWYILANLIDQLISFKSDVINENEFQNYLRKNLEL